MLIFAPTDLAPSNFSRQLEGADCGHPGVSLILVDAAPGDAPSLHTHPYAEVMVVQEGTAAVTDGETTHQVGPGHVVVIPAGQPHAFTNSGDERLRQLNIHVADAFVTDAPRKGR